MPDSTIAVAEGSYRYDPATLLAAVRQRWPDAGFTPATGRLVGLSLGQFQIPGPPAHGTMLLVEIDPEGRALDVDCPADTLAAEFISWVTCQPGFPGDGSVIIGDWGVGFVVLRANMTSAEVMAIRA